MEGSQAFTIGLDNLPPEILYMICSFMTKYEMFYLAMSSKKFNKLVNTYIDSHYAHKIRANGNEYSSDWPLVKKIDCIDFAKTINITNTYGTMRITAKLYANGARSFWGPDVRILYDNTTYYHWCQNLTPQKINKFLTNPGTIKYDDSLGGQFPAFIKKYSPSNTDTIMYCKDGKLHSEHDDTPAHFVKKNGVIVYKSWYRDGNLHRENDKPALIEKFNPNYLICEWWQNGKLHRGNDKPATTKMHIPTNVYCLIRYFQDGYLHRENDLPAVVARNYETRKVKVVEWYIQGKRQRIDQSKPVGLMFDDEKATHSLMPSMACYQKIKPH